MQRIARRIRVPLGFAFAALFLWLARPTWLSLLASSPIVAAGAWLRGYASGYVQKNETLATSGPYAHTRNPLYLGSLGLALGLIFASRSWILAACFAILFPLIYIPTIFSEEMWLRTNFSEFVDYCAHVPRLLPRLTPARSFTSGNFRRELYFKHREYNALMGIGGVYAVLVVKLLLSRH